MLSYKVYFLQAKRLNNKMEITDLVVQMSFNSGMFCGESYPGRDHVFSYGLGYSCFIASINRHHSDSDILQALLIT